jgi:excisionase family DNA binding protein
MKRVLVVVGCSPPFGIRHLYGWWRFLKFDSWRIKTMAMEEKGIDRTNNRRLVDADEMGRILKISKKTVLAMATEGRIPVYRIGVKTIRFDVDAVIKALENKM